MSQTLKNYGHLILAVLAQIWYGFPSGKLNIIGITGTDGKTTTTSLIYHILKSAGKKVSMISTVEAEIAGRSYSTGFHVTTPSPFTIQKFLAESVRHSDEYFVLETTSHALDQERVFGIQFAVGVLTNITHEHLQYHRTYDRYVQAKAKLLLHSDIRLYNRDDRSYEKINSILTTAFVEGKNLTYGLTHQSDYMQKIDALANIPLPTFNRYNFLAAYAVCRELGIDEQTSIAALKTFVSPPGRMEVVYDQSFTIIVDFAHTPNAIKEALTSVKSLYPHRRIIHVFGAAAFRDDTKRPIMGGESGTYADLVILTEEDYRTEDPLEICRQIAVGLEEKGFTNTEEETFGSASHSYICITNRQKAIQKAISIARACDVIICTGKGHEQSLCRGRREFPWDEKKAIQEALG